MIRSHPSPTLRGRPSAVVASRAVPTVNVLGSTVSSMLRRFGGCANRWRQGECFDVTRAHFRGRITTKWSRRARRSCVIEAAAAGAERFSRGDAEPGDYYVIQVLEAPETEPGGRRPTAAAADERRSD
jgi:hypothetical protein